MIYDKINRTLSNKKASAVKAGSVYAVISVLVVALSVQPAWATVNNTVTVKGFDPIGTEYTVQATEMFDVQDAAPSVAVNQTGPTTNVTAAGTVIDYTITLDNNGNVPLNGVSLTDALDQNGTSTSLTLSGPTGDTNSDGILDVNETWQYTTSYTVTQGNMDNGNDLVATASFTSTEITTAQTSAFTTTLSPTAPAMTVSGTTSVATVNFAGDAIANQVTVTNIGGVTLTSIALNDPLYTYTCPTSSSATIATLAPGASEVCTATYNATQADFDTNAGGDGLIDATTSVSGTAANSTSTPVSGSYASSVSLTQTNSLQVVKTPNTTDPVAVDDVITYTFDVTNNGNVTIANVSVTDNHNGTGTAPVPGSEAIFTDAGNSTGDSTDAAQNGVWDSLAPGDTIRFTATYTVTQTDVDTLQ